MCSVRHNRCPAPKRRATSSVIRARAHLETRSLSAHPRITLNGRWFRLKTALPMTTSPVVPLIEITSPDAR
jgi:hypothetical protein